MRCRPQCKLANLALDVGAASIWLFSRALTNERWQSRQIWARKRDNSELSHLTINAVRGPRFAKDMRFSWVNRLQTPNISRSTPTVAKSRAVAFSLDVSCVLFNMCVSSREHLICLYVLITLRVPFQNQACAYAFKRTSSAACKLAAAIAQPVEKGRTPWAPKTILINNGIKSNDLHCGLQTLDFDVMV